MPRILIIAGSDSGGGAGLQADIKTVSALGGFAMTAVTALTAQNTLGVHGVHAVPTDFIQAQMDAVLGDIGVDAVKIGMLGDAVTAQTVATALRSANLACPIVLDPVMVAKGGATLLTEDAVAILKTELIPLATLVTPNIPEAEVLTGMKITGEGEMIAAGKAIIQMGAKAAVIKGGHMDTEVLLDILVTPTGKTSNPTKRIETKNTHGTGCTMASALATYLARGYTLDAAVAEAQYFVRRAIESAPNFGAGSGPLNHNIR